MIVQVPAELNAIAGRVLGAAIEVHQTLGPGYVATCEAAPAPEMRERGLAFVPQPIVELGYTGEPVGQLSLDVLVQGALIVELKVIEALLPDAHRPGSILLKGTGCHLGLLLNFNVSQLRASGIKRVILS